MSLQRLDIYKLVLIVRKRIVIVWKLDAVEDMESDESWRKDEIERIRNEACSNPYSINSPHHSSRDLHHHPALIIIIIIKFSLHKFGIVVKDW